jgi:hypothetical protein
MSSTDHPSTRAWVSVFSDTPSKAAVLLQQTPARCPRGRVCSDFIYLSIASHPTCWVYDLQDWHPSDISCEPQLVNLCFWPAGWKLRSPSFDLINLHEWLTELRKTLAYVYYLLLMILQRIQIQRCLGQGMGKGAQSLCSPSSLPPSTY